MLDNAGSNSLNGQLIEEVGGTALNTALHRIQLGLVAKCIARGGPQGWWSLRQACSSRIRIWSSKQWRLAVAGDADISKEIALAACS